MILENLEIKLKGINIMEKAIYSSVVYLGLMLSCLGFGFSDSRSSGQVSLMLVVMNASLLVLVAFFTK